MTTPTSHLAKKLHIKSNTRVLLLGAPEGRAAALEPLPEGASVSTTAQGPFDMVLLFVQKSKALEKGGPKAMAAVREGGILWIAYPKKNSKVETDLTREVGWKVMHEAGWGGVSQIAIDATWSAMRFRPEAAVTRKENSAAAPGARRTGVARAKRSTMIVPTPSDLASALSRSDAARATWEKLMPSHRKEYVDWIEEAKRPATRTRRVSLAIEMIAAGVRDRNAKYAD